MGDLVDEVLDYLVRALACVDDQAEAPSFTSALTVAPPTPRDPPVTMAFLPERDMLGDLGNMWAYHTVRALLKASEEAVMAIETSESKGQNKERLFGRKTSSQDKEASLCA